MAIVVSKPVRRLPCCVNLNLRYDSQGTHRDSGTLTWLADVCDLRESSEELLNTFSYKQIW